MRDGIGEHYARYVITAVEESFGHTDHLVPHSVRLENIGNDEMVPALLVNVINKAREIITGKNIILENEGCHVHVVTARAGLGDATVGGNVEGEENYFTSTVLNRQEARDEAIDVLKLVTENSEASEEARAEAAERISQIAVDIQNEANIETLVRAKGFEECVAVISEGSVSVIVSADSLQASDTAKILTIVYETTGISPSKVSIINK